MRFHTQTAGFSLTAQQPEINIVRTAIEALAAVLGGTQSLHTNSFDEALALPTEDAVLIALRTQQIIAHETGVIEHDRPARRLVLRRAPDEPARAPGGRLLRADRRRSAAWSPAIEQSFFQREIADAAFRYQQEVEAGGASIVGVNRYTARATSPSRSCCGSTRRSSGSRSTASQALRGRRDAAAVEALARLRAEAAATTTNLMPAIVDAARAYVTMGEMCDALREVWGVWRETPVF